MQDDDDESSAGAYTDGYWTWDKKKQGLIFVSDLPPQTVENIVISRKAPIGTIDFRDDIDIIEQMRYRRRYQRKLKPGMASVVTLQDIKDLVIYTAPVKILSPLLIDLLHIPTTERFLRALIFSCQFYIQVAEEMSIRTKELQHKVRTVDSDIIENEVRDDISDIRLMVSKEYCAMLIGADETNRFHHMGPKKTGKSLTDKDSKLFETLLRVCIQIVWIALARKSYSEIELEVNRLFKTELYNSGEHKLKSGYISAMTSEERAVLLGYSNRKKNKLSLKSPAVEAVFSDRMTDYRLYGLGIIKFKQLPYRLQHILLAITTPEENLKKNGVTVGILGMERSCFDTMLQFIPIVAEKTRTKSSASVRIGHSVGITRSTSSRIGSQKSTTSATMHKIVPDIHLPHDIEATHVTESFPDTLETVLPCSEEQCRRWKNRLFRLLHPKEHSFRKTKTTLRK